MTDVAAAASPIVDIPEGSLVYGPAPKPDSWLDTSTPAQDQISMTTSGLANGASRSLEAHDRDKGLPGIPDHQQAVTAAALEPAEPAAPGMEPEGPMPPSEMQLIITKLAGFIQVGLHLAPATLPVRCPHLSQALASGT